MSRTSYRTGLTVPNLWLLSVLAAGSLPANECKDFTGGEELSDCDPICWTAVECCTAEFVPSDVGLELHPTLASRIGIAFTSRALAGDARINLRAQIIGDDARSLLGCLHWDTVAFNGYFGGLRRDQSGTWTIGVAIWENHQRIGRTTSPISFDPTSGPVEIEFQSVGGRLELRAWLLSSSRPELPQYVSNDTRFREGAVGFGYTNWDRASHAVVRQFCYAERDDAIFKRGDCNDDTDVDLSDAVCILNWLFTDRATPGCVAATNADGDDAADITDATYLLNYLFAGGPSPVAPFPDCGPEMSPAELGCADPPACQ